MAYPMRMKILPVFRAFACLVVLASAAAAKEPAKPAIDPVQSLATFDAAWRLVDESPYDVRGKGIDWDAVRARHRPDAAKAGDVQALRRSILAMLQEVGESHFSLIPASVGALSSGGNANATPADTRPRDTGMRAALVDGRATVLSVRPGSPAGRLGIRPGWMIESVDARPVATALGEIARMQDESLRRSAMLEVDGALRSRLEASVLARPVSLGLRDGAGRLHDVDLVPEPAPGIPVDMPMLPPLVFDLAHERLPLADGGCIGLIRFNLWAPALAQAFPRALDAVRQCRGLVIDLRGNPGGVIGTAMGVGGYLVDSPTPLGYINAGGSTARLPALPRRVSDTGDLLAPYAGALALIIDGGSASTSEVFVSGLQSAHRARVFGTRSAGMALPSVAKTLPNGDRLMYAIADLTAPNGERLEGRGIQPDQPVPPTAADLLAGRDNALEAARRWLIDSPSAPRKEHAR